MIQTEIYKKELDVQKDKKSTQKTHNVKSSTEPVIKDQRPSKGYHRQSGDENPLQMTLY